MRYIDDYKNMVHDECEHPFRDYITTRTSDNRHFKVCTAYGCPGMYEVPRPKDDHVYVPADFTELLKEKGVTPPKFKTLGQIAYEYYYEFSKGESLVSRVPLPLWDDENETPTFRVVKEAWEYTAQKLSEYMKGSGQ